VRICRKLSKQINNDIWVILDKIIRREKYLQIGSAPSRLWFPVIKSVNKLVPNEDKFSNMDRYLFATRQLNNPLETEASLPKIEVLLMAKAEDLDVLMLAVEGVWYQSQNKIHEFVIVVPSRDVESIKGIFSSKLFPAVIIDEDQLISSGTRKLIRVNRPDRYGWILQQVIAAQWLINTEAEFTLLLDTDTILVRPKVWVADSKVQILMPTFEYNPEYYKFFKSKSKRYDQKKWSFVSHHLLVQTKIFKEIFEEYWQSNLEVALTEAFNFSSPTEFSPFDLKFEIYSHFLLSKYPRLVKFCKWANFSEPRSAANGQSYQEIQANYSRQYNSVSFHHYT